MNCQGHLRRGQVPTSIARRWFFQHCGVGFGVILGTLFRRQGLAATRPMISFARVRRLFRFALVFFCLLSPRFLPAAAVIGFANSSLEFGEADFAYSLPVNLVQPAIASWNAPNSGTLRSYRSEASRSKYVAQPGERPHASPCSSHHPFQE